jgi:hypothetical protein
LRSVTFNLLDDIVTLDNLAKDGVLTIQPRSLGGGDEELRSVAEEERGGLKMRNDDTLSILSLAILLRVGTSIGHAQETNISVLEGKVFIGKLFTIDGATTGTVLTGKVTTLAHETGNDTVEGRSGITETLFASAQGSKVFS